jgi:hypothetical protein
VSDPTMRKLVTIVIAAHVAAAVPVALATAPLAAAEESSSNPSATASVVRVDHVKAKRTKVVRHRFRPWRHPSPRQVRMAIRAEAKRWKIPAASLARRVSCESHFHWWASNGQYAGVLQFAPGTFQRGLRTIRHRRVKLVKTRTRKVNDMRVYHYSDGRTARKRGRPVRQRVIHVYRGKLPRRPAAHDTWTQLRIGAQAIRGISAVRSSEWSCGT